MDAPVKQAKLDPVTLEVIRNALPAISTEMAADLQRTSYNMMIYEVRDFCTAVLTGDGELVSQNVGGVSHFVADLGVLIVDGVKRYGKDGFKPGDVLLTNHQAVAGQHLNNVVTYIPYFFQGELLMFTMVRAHWIDVGGMSTGFGAGAHVQDPWLEGLQFDQLKIIEAGKRNDMLYRMIRDNIRFPESSLGDLNSQIAACRLAVRRLDELFHKYGRDTLLGALAHVFDETEARCRNVVAQLKDGEYEGQSFLDDDGINAGERVKIHARVTIESGHMTIDLSGCSGERPVGINARTLAGPRIAYKALTSPHDPVNEGSFRALDAVIPEGNIMMARYPTPMSGWSTCIPITVDTILSALAPAMPERIPATHHGVLGGHVFFGVDPKTRRRFVLQTIEGGGWGGRPFEDGESATVSVCQGDVRNASIEGIELKCPLLVEARELRQDSGGAGRYRGGLGINLRVRNLVEGRWNLRRPRRQQCPPWGLWGGKPGEPGNYLVRRENEQAYQSVDGVRYLVPPNTRVVCQSSGGAGWGEPLDREPERVRWDVVEGLVSRQAARDRYGVVLCEDDTVDEAATSQLRRERHSQPASAAA
jgi:N-methylhydantoinase B